MSRFLDIQLDEGCLQRAAAGDAAAQRQFYERTAGPVFGLVRRLVPGHAAAEDVFQDCMLALLGALGGFRREAPLGAWVRQVALRQCLMHLRSPWQRARRRLQSVAGTDGSATPEPEESTELPLPELIDLERALARLPELSRAVLWLHDAEGLTHEEIAACFGRTPSFSKSQLARAHATLRAQLGAGSPAAKPMPARDIAVQGQSL